MFKIKLSILLLISSIFLSCTKNNVNHEGVKYSIGYIGGEYYGLILKNLLTNNLSNFGLYDNNSNYRIEASITHSTELFITNIDNTSDRMKVKSSLVVKVYDTRFKCVTNKFSKDVSQFYIFAKSDRYISNNRAEKKIREENTEGLVKNFINNLMVSENRCTKINE